MSSTKKSTLKWVVIFLVFLCLCLPGTLLIWMGTQIARKVMRVSHGNITLQTAAHQAQSQLPEFIASLKNPKPNERFAVESAFKSQAGTEYMWSKDVTLSGDGFKAYLDQDPISSTTVKKGDLVTIEKDQIYDWKIKEPDGSIRGGFVEKAMNGNQ